MLSFRQWTAVGPDSYWDGSEHACVRVCRHKRTAINPPFGVLQAIKGLKIDKASGPNHIPNGVLRHLLKRALTFLTKLFKAILRKQYFPPVWKQARVVCILKPGKDPTLPSSYRPISLLVTVVKLFEKTLLSRVLREVNERVQLRDV
jgi:hypothetical protein